MRQVNASDGAFGVAILGAILGGLALFTNILLWLTLSLRGQKLDFDAMAWSMSVLQTLLAVLALGGFWMIRGAALLQAKDTAEQEAKTVAGTAAEAAALQ